MDVNQERPPAQNESTETKVRSSSSDNRLLGAALGGAVGILASRLLGVPPRVGVTIGSLVGANAERIGPQLFPGKALNDAKNLDEANAIDTVSAKSLLRELAQDRGPDGLPQTLQEVLDDYLALEDDEDHGERSAALDTPAGEIAAGQKPVQTIAPETDERETRPSSPVKEEPLQLHKEAKTSMPVARIEDLPIAPPFQIQESVSPQLTSPAPEIEKTTEAIAAQERPQRSKDSIGAAKVSVGQNPPPFPAKPMAPAPEGGVKTGVQGASAPAAPHTPDDASKLTSRNASEPPATSANPAQPPAQLAQPESKFSAPTDKGVDTEAATPAGSFLPAAPSAAGATAVTDTNVVTDAESDVGASTATSTVVESLWSRPPSTVLSDGRHGKGDEEAAILNSTEVPDQTSVSGKADSLGVRGSVPSTTEDSGSNFLADESDETSHDVGRVPPSSPEAEELNKPAPPPQEMVMKTLEQSVAPAEKPPLSSPAAGAQSVPGVGSRPPQSIFTKPPANLTSPPIDSKLSGSGIPRPPLFRPAPKKIDKQAGDVPEAQQSEPAPSAKLPDAPSQASALGQASTPLGQAGAPPAKQNPAELDPSSGLAKPALFTNVPPVAQSIVQNATKLPIARTAAPPVLGNLLQPTPAAPSKPTAAPEQEASEQKNEPAFSRLFKPADPVAEKDTETSAELPAKTSKGKLPGSSPAAAAAANAQSAPQKPQPAVVRNGPNPFMSGGKSSAPTAGGSATQPLPPAHTSRKGVPSVSPGSAAGKSAFKPFKPTPEKAESSRTDIGAKRDEGHTSEAAPIEAPPSLKPPGTDRPAAGNSLLPGSESFKKETVSQAGSISQTALANTTDDSPAVMAASQNVAAKEVKGAVVESVQVEKPKEADTQEKVSAPKPEPLQPIDGTGDRKITKKGGLWRKVLLLSFPIVLACLAFAGFKFKPQISDSLSKVTGMFAPPELTPPANTLDGSEIKRPTNAEGENPVPDNIPPRPDKSASGVAVPPPNARHSEEVVGDLLEESEGLSMPEGAIVQILPARDIPNEIAVSTSDNDSESFVDPIVQEFEKAKSVVRSLLMSSSTAEAASWVHDPGSSEQMMKLYYGSTGITPTESISIDLVNAGTVPGSDSNAYLMKVISPDHPEGFPVSIEQTDDGYKVDWDAFIQCKDRLLEKFYSSQPSVSETFYVTLKRGHHFDQSGGAGGNSTLANKLCFKVSSPLPTDPSQYAYADSNSVVGRELDARIQWNKVYFPVVELEWVPSDGSHTGYMRISKFVRDTWRKTH